MATYTRRYETSEDVKKKEQAYRDALAAVPTYTSQYQPQIDSLRDSIVNRDGFKYDVNADAMYQQLRDQYQQQGRMAMMDIIGQTTALTGGYGNSYAQNAGQQAYHGYLMNLNNQIPDLYNMALNRYAQEGDDMARNYSLLLNQEAQDYGRWQDQYDQWQTGLNRLYSEYQTAADADYNRFRDEVADDKWQTEYDLALGAASGGGSGGGSGGVGEEYKVPPTHEYPDLVKTSQTPEVYDLMSYQDWQQRRNAYLTGRTYTGANDPVVAAGVEDYGSYADYSAAITANNIEAQKYMNMKREYDNRR